MKNKDFNQTQLAIAQRISNAAKEGNTEEFEAGLQEMFAAIEENILDTAAGMQSSADAAVLAQRGVRQLSSAEVKFYNGLIEGLRASETTDIRMALGDVDKTFPETIVSAVMEDMIQAHPLLDAVDTMSVTGLTRYLMNTDTGDTATWGSLTDAISKEISSGFKEVQLDQNKLSAFMPISKDMLALGPLWIDTYIRRCLSEALAMGYEKAIITGTGNHEPIGMDRSVADDVSVTGGVYPQKDKITVTDFKPATFGSLTAKLAKTRNGKNRPVTGLIMVVNPQDYHKIVMPATTILTHAGVYVNNILPVPCEIIQSAAVADGEAILGMGKRYFLGVAGNRGIEFSDEYKFIEDQRYYKIVAYANGLPKDDNSFLRLDISGVEPLALLVETKSESTDA